MKALAAEMTASFSKRLQPLGISVRELTGDMQLTKNEILQTQVSDFVIHFLSRHADIHFTTGTEINFLVFDTYIGTSSCNRKYNLVIRFVDSRESKFECFIL